MIGRVVKARIDRLSRSVQATHSTNQEVGPSVRGILRGHSNAPGSTAKQSRDVQLALHVLELRKRAQDSEEPIPGGSPAGFLDQDAHTVRRCTQREFSPWAKEESNSRMLTAASFSMLRRCSAPVSGQYVGARDGVYCCSALNRQWRTRSLLLEVGCVFAIRSHWKWNSHRYLQH